MSEPWLKLQWPKFQMPRKRPDSIQQWLDSGISDEEWEKLSQPNEIWDEDAGMWKFETQKQVDARMGKYHRSSSAEHLKMKAHKDAVDQKARMAEFEAAQQGAPQRFVSHGKPFAMSRYKDTSMFPAKSMPVSDPARIQATPVGYDKEPWWRHSPYVSPRQPGYSIFSMKPYSW
jgi:hypothetical protein